MPGVRTGPNPFQTMATSLSADACPRSLSCPRRTHRAGPATSPFDGFTFAPAFPTRPATRLRHLFWNVRPRADSVQPVAAWKGYHHDRPHPRFPALPHRGRTLHGPRSRSRARQLRRLCPGAARHARVLRREGEPRCGGAGPACPARLLLRLRFRGRNRAARVSVSVDRGHLQRLPESGISLRPAGA